MCVRARVGKARPHKKALKFIKTQKCRTPKAPRTAAEKNISAPATRGTGADVRTHAGIARSDFFGPCSVTRSADFDDFG